MKQADSVRPRLTALSQLDLVARPEGFSDKVHGMYGYWLHSAHNRPAREGEELVVKRFDTGNLAFVSVSDLEQLQRKNGVWSELLDWLMIRTSARISTVSIFPGAHLLLRNVPLKVQESLGIEECEEVVLSEVSGRTYSYRDALMLPDHTKVLVQDLCEGVEATVLSLSSDISAHEEELHLAS